ncbi:MAG: hypothetical protein HW400_21 [Candidatus Levybacteria bacterium]|nr:hypothetical protein [Candidatus Levybacteria bacterium]
MTLENSLAFRTRTPRAQYSETESEIQKGYETKKRIIFENLTNAILASIVDNGKISNKIYRYPIGILKTLSTPKYNEMISKELGFNLAQTNAMTSPKENEITTNFLIKGIKKIYEERLTSNGNLDTKKLLAKEAKEKGFNWNKIEKMLRTYWSEHYFAGVKNDQAEKLRLRNATIILIFIRDHPQLNVIGKARKLEISTTTLNYYKNNFRLDEATGVAVEIKNQLTPNLKFHHAP